MVDDLTSELLGLSIARILSDKSEPACADSVVNL